MFPCRRRPPPVQVDFGEEADSKQVLLVAVSPTTPAKVTTVGLTSPVVLRTVEGTEVELRSRRGEFGQALLRIRVKDSKNSAGLANRIREWFPNALEVRIDPEPTADEVAQHRTALSRVEAMIESQAVRFAENTAAIDAAASTVGHPELSVDQKETAAHLEAAHWSGQGLSETRAGPHPTMRGCKQTGRQRPGNARYRLGASGGGHRAKSRTRSSVRVTPARAGDHSATHRLRRRRSSGDGELGSPQGCPGRSPHGRRRSCDMRPRRENGLGRSPRRPGHGRGAVPPSADSGALIDGWDQLTGWAAEQTDNQQRRFHDLKTTATDIRLAAAELRSARATRVSNDLGVELLHDPLDRELDRGRTPRKPPRTESCGVSRKAAHGPRPCATSRAGGGRRATWPASSAGCFRRDSSSSGSWRQRSGR